MERLNYTATRYSDIPEFYLLNMYNIVLTYARVNHVIFLLILLPYGMQKYIKERIEKEEEKINGEEEEFLKNLTNKSKEKRECENTNKKKRRTIGDRTRKKREEIKR